MSPGNSGEWDAEGIGSPTLVFNNPNYQMWYFCVNSNNIFQVGYATSPISTGIAETTNVTHGILLSQNYPNPFNPITNIEFSLPQSDFVALKIYNLLGEEVAPLVSENLVSGKYKYNWDASVFASRLYYYTLEAGKYKESKKLLLLK